MTKENDEKWRAIQETELLQLLSYKMKLECIYTYLQEQAMIPREQTLEYLAGVAKEYPNVSRILEEHNLTPDMMWFDDVARAMIHKYKII